MKHPGNWGRPPAARHGDNRGSGRVGNAPAHNTPLGAGALNLGEMADFRNGRQLSLCLM